MLSSRNCTAKIAPRFSAPWSLDHPGHSRCQVVWIYGDYLWRAPLLLLGSTSETSDKTRLDVSAVVTVAVLSHRWWALFRTRLAPLQCPFLWVGIDYCGPLFVTLGQSKVKRWGLKITGLTTRAIHLEVSWSLDTASFLCSFDRFIYARGKPAKVFSDNGTNFVADEKELRHELEPRDLERIHNKFANQGIKWYFPPPLGPHFGGVWERLVQSCKQALQLELRARTVNCEILATMFQRFEGLLNSRPLTHISVDPDDPVPLSPFHFFTREPQPTFPDVEPQVISTRNRWKMTQSITASVWERWMKE